MIRFLLNNQTVETDLPAGMTVLDFVRYNKNLKGTKIGCREGDCGACTVLVGELRDGAVRYRSMTSCLMPLANARGKHIVTIEGINPNDGGLTPAQAALVAESGTQCGFCTVGFVMSMTGYCLADGERSDDAAVSAIDGNICRCTGYKSIERAAKCLESGLQAADSESRLRAAIASRVVPAYFASIAERLKALPIDAPESQITDPQWVAGGTDLYVQKHDELAHSRPVSLFDYPELRFIRENGRTIEIGPSTVVTDLLESDVFARAFPDLYRHLKLVSSTPIRNMATIGGNFVNASPIGDMTAWFIALGARLELRDADRTTRTVPLADLYLGYKKLDKLDSEIISKISFEADFTHFNFEKVSKRTFLDIASVNSAIAIRVADGVIEMARVSIGGVAPIPLLLRRTSEFLTGKPFDDATFAAAEDLIQDEIAPISDVRGSAGYKRLLARQLFRAHAIRVQQQTAGTKL